MKTYQQVTSFLTMMRGEELEFLAVQPYTSQVHVCLLNKHLSSKRLSSSQGPTNQFRNALLLTFEDRHSSWVLLRSERKYAVNYKHQKTLNTVSKIWDL